jgi:Na+/H+ antiporter NhaC
LAWALKGCCDALETDVFLTEILADRISPFAYPAILFLVASITSFATGTSWGTMAILIPTAIPIAFKLDGDVYGLTTMISLGAVLDGAIFGDHCSPISDTTIISSMSSNCNLMQHVRTQLPYSLFVAVVALACGYIPAVFGLAWIWSLLLAATVTIVAFAVPAMKKQPASPADDLRD